MSTDKLADALETSDTLCDGCYCWGNERRVADWLRSPEGVAALAEDETIREGVFRAVLPDGATEWRAE